MRLVGDTRIDFMKGRNVMLAVSAILIVASLGVLFTRGVKPGVEFSGGAQVILRYNEAPQINEVRDALAAAGFGGASVTTSALQADSGVDGQDVIVRVATREDAEAESKTEPAAEAPQQAQAAGQDLTAQVVETLRGERERDQLALGMIDLNTADQSTLAERMANEAAIDPDEAMLIADRLVDWRRTHGGVFSSIDDLSQVGGVTDEATTYLSGRAFVGSFGLRGQEYIEASVSEEMRDKARWAIIGALAGMLIYIWIRFQFQWGLAAIIALLHDTIITLGAFSIGGMEANLPVVAAFLTLVGYSVNDSIVIFDRIRENLKTRGTSKLYEVINVSINQNLSRTLITSVTTWAVVLSLFVIGGAVIRPFAFVLLIGIVVGTYSSIYVASPILMIWQQLSAKYGTKRSAQRKPARAAR